MGPSKRKALEPPTVDDTFRRETRSMSKKRNIETGQASEPVETAAAFTETGQGSEPDKISAVVTETGEGSDTHVPDNTSVVTETGDGSDEPAAEKKGITTTVEDTAWSGSKDPRTIVEHCPGKDASR